MANPIGQSTNRTDVGSFLKYDQRGAYHWSHLSRSLRRHHAYTAARYRFVVRAIQGAGATTVLDVGCGDAALAYLLSSQGCRVVGVDSSPAAIELGRSALAGKSKAIAGRISLHCRDGEDLPLSPNSFDAVVMAEVLEHVPGPSALLDEALRVLRPGGTCVLTTPYRLTREPADRHHKQELYPEQVADVLSGSGFVETEVCESHPIFWKELYERRLFGRFAYRYFINLASVLGWNPLSADSRSAKWRHYSLICAAAKKPA